MKQTTILAEKILYQDDYTKVAKLKLRKPNGKNIVRVKMEKRPFVQNIKIRKIRRTDLPYFLKWWKDKALIKLTSGRYEESEDVLKGYYFEMLNAKNDRHYVILRESKIIGNISLIRKNKNIFEILIIIGEKKYWGIGIGQAAIERLLKIAFTKLDYKKASIEVRPENLRAIKLYKKCGFVETGFKKNIKNKNQPVVLKMILTGNNWLRKNLLDGSLNAPTTL